MSHRALQIVMICLFSFATALAQPAQQQQQKPPARGGGGGMGGAQGIIVGGGGVGGGGFAPAGKVMVMNGGGARFKEQTLDALREQLEVTDDEWEKLSPKIEKVMDAKQKTGTGAGLSWSSQNGAAPVFRISEGKMDTPPGLVMQDIREAIANKETPPEEITKKLAALKEASEKARAEYLAAQKELKAALTPRQQAILMMTGHLEP